MDVGSPLGHPGEQHTLTGDGPAHRRHPVQDVVGTDAGIRDLEGTFEGAHDWRIAQFTEFPAALSAHRAELAGKRVVSFCTGGIRCEKAAILMQSEGIADVVQLDGGILRYFEEVGGAHYRGSCYVFDKRRALDPALDVSPLRARVR